jgi:4'-phosphopantetheinyl transferase
MKREVSWAANVERQHISSLCFEAVTTPETLHDDEVHLLQCRLDRIELDASCLSPDEHARAARFHRARDRERFVAGRAWLRHVLSRYVGTAPARLELTAGPHGKPALAPQHAALQFNLAHTGSLALLALTRAGAVGVDVEAIAPMAELSAIAQRQFAAAEWQRWSALAERDRLQAFYACWTRKEAYVKALGDGLLAPLDAFEVAFEPDRAAALLSVDGSTHEAARWTMWSVDTEPGHCAAVVVRGRALALRRIDHR